eukprot:TCONS_00049310-protein
MASWKNRDSSRVSYNKLGQDDSTLEHENDRMVNNLASKVSTIKNIAIDLDNEAKYQNQFLGDMGNDFDSAGGFLGSSMKRLNAMVASGSSNRKLMCYMVFFLVLIFFICYYLVGKLSR